MELNNPALTFAVALAAGITGQAVAQHLRMPGIVLLLLAGALLGPDGLNLVRPQTLGEGLHLIVGLSVAVILFEGGLSLNIGRLRREAVVIRRLVTLGLLITAAGGTLAARLFLGWPWAVAILFGTLVTVTGPTVITPLLRRVRVKAHVSTILEAEGVLIDPIGAIIAVVALELVLGGAPGEAAQELLGLPSRLVLGTIVGLVGGAIIATVLRYETILPEAYENVFTLSLVLVLFQVSDAIQAESGLMAAVVAGLVVGNVRSRISRELREFKEQVTVLLVGLLFVLLAADVRLADVTGLGWAGIATVVTLMLVVRPLDVLASTWGSQLSWRERSFVAWLGPRGIVAAAVASIFADRLVASGYDVGIDMRALVFLVIALTVVIQGLTSGPVASVLGVRRPSERGFALVGANALGRVLAHALDRVADGAVLIDTNPVLARAAQDEGLRVVYGDVNDERVRQQADIAGRRGFVAVSANEGTNLLLAQRARRDFRVPAVYAAIDRRQTTLSRDRAQQAGARMLFGRALDLRDWMHVLDHDEAEIQRWRYAGEEEIRLSAGEAEGRADARQARPWLPLVLVRDGTGTPVDEETRVRNDDVVVFAAPIDSPTATPRGLGLGEWILVHTPGMDPAERERESHEEGSTPARG